MFRQLGIILVISLGSFVAAGQDTLPRFTVLNKGNDRIVVSWTNPYKQAIRQLSIQRSTDSTKNFKTILTLPDPTVPQNGYVDTKALTPFMFYRIYILLDSGKYLFSVSKRPTLDTVKVIPRAVMKPADQQRVQEEPVPTNRKPVTDVVKPTTPVKEPKDSVREEKKPVVVIPERIIYVKKRDTLIAQIGERSFRRFRDSIAMRTKDSLSFNTPDTAIIKPFIPKEVYRPSKFVYTEKDGNVRIALPNAATKKYSIKFFEEDNSFSFEVKQVKDTMLIMDKSNFGHSGWFKFELYEDGVLKEKHKLFIPKDF
jgi:hypothetical protein